MHTAAFGRQIALRWRIFVVSSVLDCSSFMCTWKPMKVLLFPIKSCNCRVFYFIWIIYLMFVFMAEQNDTEPLTHALEPDVWLQSCLNFSFNGSECNVTRVLSERISLKRLLQKNKFTKRKLAGESSLWADSVLRINLSSHSQSVSGTRPGTYLWPGVLSRAYLSEFLPLRPMKDIAGIPLIMQSFQERKFFSLSHSLSLALCRRSRSCISAPLVAWYEQLQGKTYFRAVSYRM